MGVRARAGQILAWAIGAIALARTCAPCAPVRTGSSAFAHVALGGAPVSSSVPPWHIVQRTFQLTKLGVVWSWQVPQPWPAAPPERSFAWQPWHSASPRFAATAWKQESSRASVRWP